MSKHADKNKVQSTYIDIILSVTEKLVDLAWKAFEPKQYNIPHGPISQGYNGYYSGWRHEDAPSFSTSEEEDGYRWKANKDKASFSTSEEDSYGWTNKTNKSSAYIGR